MLEESLKPSWSAVDMESMEYVLRWLDNGESRSRALSWLPSYADLFLVALLPWLFAQGPGWGRLLRDADTGWHIRTGDYILAHRTVPHQDLFSFSRPGAGWFAWEWLTDVLFSVLHSTWGLAGVAFVCGLTIVATATVCLRHMARSGANVYIALCLTVLFLGAGSVHYHARPHVFTMLFLAVSVAAVQRDLRRRSRELWWLVPLTAVWTNMHGGFLAGIALLGLTAAGTAVEEYLRDVPDWRRPLRYALVCVACGAASLLNPYGWQLHVHVREYLQSSFINNLIQEFQSPSFHSEGTLQFELLLFVGLGCAILAVRRRQIAGALPLFYFAHAALGAARHIPLFAVVSLPVVAMELTLLWNSWLSRRAHRSAFVTLNDIGHDAAAAFGRITPWAAAGVLAVAWLTPHDQWPTDFTSELFPNEMVCKHADLFRSARLLSSDQWGDYLIYHFYPRIQVYIDGRSDFFGEKIGRDYLTMLEMQPSWKSVLDARQFDAVLAPVTWPLASALRLAPDWSLVDADSKAVLYVRKTRTLPVRVH